MMIHPYRLLTLQDMNSLYINGVLQVRGGDYTATTGTTVTGLTALVANDVVEIFSAVARTVADVYTQTQSDAKYYSKTSSASSGEASTVNINTKPWNMPWGVVGHVTTSPAQTITTVTDVTGMTVTFSAVSGRRYKTTLNLEFYNTNANSLTDIFLCDSANTSLRGWTVQIKDANLQTPYFLNWIESGLSGSTTRKLRMARGFGSSANIVTFSSQQITVEDIGPA
jgi:hypothetical protein